jgi:hypothetical protein
MGCSGRQTAGLKWAAAIAARDASSLEELRLWPGVEVCRQDGQLWLRGADLDDETRKAIRRVPGAVFHELKGDGRLRLLGARLHKGRLPQGPWQALSSYLAVEAPSAALGGQRPVPAALSVVRISAERPANGILTTLSAWAAYVDTAAAIRLRCVSFAVASDGRVIVRGTPIPPVAGLRLVEDDGVAVPCGWAWTPTVEAAVVRELLGLEDDDFALLTPEEPVVIIRADSFAAACRSAVRLTAREAAHG